ncbi:MAG TPA: NADH:ubiquinone reductase (Na(+)-transporting) subunit B, partial [Planctomycetaceae bacterium]|nr:NADH:ubiquinone reductase (Na(+)-transporting) subunit B [Planctomycetaceae bacterium]
MNFLRRILDNLHPKFDKGGKLEKFYPLYEGIDTFLYSPDEVTKGASHVRDGIDLKRMMTTVIVALIPCVAMAFWNTGYQANLELSKMAADAAAANQGWRGSMFLLLGGTFDPMSTWSNILLGGLYFLPVYIVTMVVGGSWELLFCIVRKHELNEGFLVTGMLFPLTLPPTIPLWQVALGISFGVVIGKEIFGGTGKNFLNPALTARAFLYFAYPAQISGDAVWTAVDGLTSATALTALGTADAAVGMGAVNVTWWESFVGIIPGSMGETSALACLVGAAILILSGIGSWRIMAGTVLGAMIFSTWLWSAGSETNAVFALPPYWHLVVGGFAFGTVFMATDPVSASMTETGKWFYGMLIGMMTILIRVVNPAFPEGIMLAILF